MANKSDTSMMRVCDPLIRIGHRGPAHGDNRVRAMVTGRKRSTE